MKISPPKPLLTHSIDLHGMTVIEARKALKEELNRMPKNSRELEVIHGSNGGIKLQTLVRKEFSHPRLEKKILTLNQGVTLFLLKP